jgi:hypothetical protein
MFSKVKAPFGAFGSRDTPQDNQKSEEQGASLTTVLPTEEDRGALTLLVADCTEVMRQNVIDVFDAKQTGQQYDTLTNMEPVTGDQAIFNPDVEPGTVDVSAMDKAKRELDAREKEVKSAKMQELKKAALTYFDDWREHVILRVGEVVNSKEKAEAQKTNSRPKTEKPGSANKRWWSVSITITARQECGRSASQNVSAHRQHLQKATS